MQCASIGVSFKHRTLPVKKPVMDEVNVWQGLNPTLAWPGIITALIIHPLSFPRTLFFWGKGRKGRCVDSQLLSIAHTANITEEMYVR